MTEQLIEILEMLSRDIPIEWDRYTIGGKCYSVYGWIERTDKKRDFVLIEYWSDDHQTSFTTSSAKYSKEIYLLLEGTTDGHNDCIKIIKPLQLNKPLKLKI